MKRILIIVMLSIILYSTLTPLIPLWPQQENYKMLLDSVYGAVSAEKFSYWTFGQKGPLTVELTSVTGDADLFVGYNLRPSYEADKNNFSSETCGIDSVFIPKDFPRPIVIGVYGHWPYNNSQFSMKVFTDLEAFKTTSYTPEDEKVFVTPNARMVESSLNGAKDKQSMQAEITARDEDEKSRFLQFYRVLETMFGLLV